MNASRVKTVSVATWTRRVSDSTCCTSVQDRVSSVQCTCCQQTFTVRTWGWDVAGRKRSAFIGDNNSSTSARRVVHHAAGRAVAAAARRPRRPFPDRPARALRLPWRVHAQPPPSPPPPRPGPPGGGTRRRSLAQIIYDRGLSWRQTGNR